MPINNAWRSHVNLWNSLTEPSSADPKTHGRSVSRFLLLFLLYGASQLNIYVSRPRSTDRCRVFWVVGMYQIGLSCTTADENAPSLSGSKATFISLLHWY